MVVKLYTNKPTSTHKRGLCAEEVCLQKYKQLQLQNGSKLIMFLNQSPCGRCAEKLRNFIKNSPVVITVDIKCMHLYRTEGKNCNFEKSNNRRGLYRLWCLFNVTIEIISNEDWLTLFRWLRLNYWEKHDVSTIRPFVVHIAVGVLRVTKKCPNGVLYNYENILDNWCIDTLRLVKKPLADDSIDSLLNKMFNMKHIDVRTRRDDFNKIKREFKILKQSQSLKNDNVVSTRRIILTLMGLDILYKPERMFDTIRHDINVINLKNYTSFISNNDVSVRESLHFDITDTEKHLFSEVKLLIKYDEPILELKLTTFWNAIQNVDVHFKVNRCIFEANIIYKDSQTITINNVPPNCSYFILDYTCEDNISDSSDDE